MSSPPKSAATPRPTPQGGTAREAPRPKPVLPSRDSVTTIRDDGSRRFLHPSDAHGRFTTARRVTAVLLVGVYLLLPWIPVGGHPALFLDLAGRRFHLFGWTLAAQDLWLTFFLITGLGFSLFLLTALLGRVWCGWACPQTVFLDHVYRRIERWMEGDAPARRALDAAPWSTTKVLRRGTKQVLFFVVSAGIAHLFLAYFVSIPELWAMMTTAPGEHWSSFVFVFVASAVLYFNFAWFREQLCIVICPYGRLQSALIDDHSLIIGYDATRGEPRGRLGSPGAADCVDCNRCVQVCPTGIDIRQGLQIECIGCAACIDACDQVMTRLKRPTGLIRYDSGEAFAGRKTKWLRPRTVMYMVLLLVGAAVAGWALSTVKPASVGFTRMRGAPYFVEETQVRNQFLVRLVNKRSEPVAFTVKPVDVPKGAVVTGFEIPVELPGLGEEVRPLVVQVPREHYTGKVRMYFEVSDVARSFVIQRPVEFVGPDVRLLEEAGRR